MSDVVMVAVQDIRIGDRVRFTPGSDSEPDLVTRVHLRYGGFFGLAVTVSHPNGCWTKTWGEEVERVDRMTSEALEAFLLPSPLA